MQTKNTIWRRKNVYYILPYFIKTLFPNYTIDPGISLKDMDRPKSTTSYVILSNCKNFDLLYLNYKGEMRTNRHYKYIQKYVKSLALIENNKAQVDHLDFRFNWANFVL